MWRDKSDDPLTNTLSYWRLHRHEIDFYLESLEIFFAPTSLAWDIRRHVEGLIAKSLRHKHRDDALYYPNDNWTFAKRDKLGISVSITSIARSVDWIPR